MREKYEVMQESKTIFEVLYEVRNALLSTAGMVTTLEDLVYAPSASAPSTIPGEVSTVSAVSMIRQLAQVTDDVNKRLGEVLAQIGNK